VPVGAFGLADIVKVEVPEPVTEVGLNEELIRAGNPVTLKATLLENGPTGATVILYVVLERRRTVWPLGETEIEKSATTSVTWVECVRLPLVAVIVSG